MVSIISQDICDIHTRLSAYHSDMSGKKYFITGGTGYIGRWILNYFLHATNYCPGVSIHVLSRNPGVFIEKNPQFLGNGAFQFHQGDVRSFEFKLDDFDYVIHGAADASALLNAERPLELFDTIVEGTRNIIKASIGLPIRKHLFLSSGAIYGPQPVEVARVSECWQGGPDITNAVFSYAEAKRAAEMLYAAARHQFGLNYVSTRIFSILGPMVPRDRHFAAGNFIDNALRKEPVVVRGNGRAVRSYIYPSDLIVALLTLLFSGECGTAYNVGSDEAVSILDLATMISRIVGNGEVRVLDLEDGGWNPGPYVPDVSKLHDYVGYNSVVDLTTAIWRTAQAVQEAD